MGEKTLYFIGFDSWNRPVYKDSVDRIWKASEPVCKDLALVSEHMEKVGLFTSTNNYFDGEPCCPMDSKICFTIKEVLQND